MPIIRSILNIGNSKAVTIPKSWLTNAEDQTGRKIIALAMEVNGTITLQPVLKRKQNTRKSPHLKTCLKNVGWRNMVGLGKRQKLILERTTNQIRSVASPLFMSVIKTCYLQKLPTTNRRGSGTRNSGMVSKRKQRHNTSRAWQDNPKPSRKRPNQWIGHSKVLYTWILLTTLTKKFKVDFKFTKRQR